MSEIKVIGAGFGRTGTLTLKAALEELGFDPCYHMKEVMLKNKFKAWGELADDNCSKTEKNKILKQALQGYQASVDFPSSILFEEQMELYPNAKVLLSVRDTPESWVKSVKSTIFGGVMGNKELLMQQEWFQKLVGTVPFIWLILDVNNKSKMKKGFDRIFLEKEVKWDEESLVQVYKNWIEHVKRVVPKDKLLIYNVKEGWEPLCRHLNVPVPKTPMPRVNDTAQFKNTQKLMGTFFSVIIFAWYSFVIYCLTKLCNFLS